MERRKIRISWARNANLVGEYPEPPYFCHILHTDISSGFFDIRNREGEIKTAGNEIA